MPLAQTLIDWLPQLPYTVALAAVATLGYLIGRRRPSAEDIQLYRTQAEVERAKSVALELEKISSAVRRNLSRHHASVARFKERVGELTSGQDAESWQRLCAEADEFLKPTLRLANEIAQAYDELRQQSTHLMALTEARTDALTCVRNRRAMDEVLQGLVAMKNRYDQEFSLAILDLDYFKKVNDEQGHLAGDQILRTFANVLSDAVRETDVVARYGGEEFVVLMPRTALENAATFSERLRGMIERSELSPACRITVSIGVAAIHKGEESQDVLQRADEALYHAKAAGRNRVFLHDGTHIELVTPAVQPIVAPTSDSTGTVEPATT